MLYTDIQEGLLNAVYSPYMPWVVLLDQHILPDLWICLCWTMNHILVLQASQVQVIYVCPVQRCCLGLLDLTHLAESLSSIHCVSYCSGVLLGDMEYTTQGANTLSGYSCSASQVLESKTASLYWTHIDHLYLGSL